MYKTNFKKDSDNNIISYEYEIIIPKKKKLKGSLSRDDMATIYKLYSSSGMNMTCRQVARSFPQFTFDQFKIILRAFGITKASLPLAPHDITEKSIDEAVDNIFYYKELEVAKKVESVAIKRLEDQVRDLAIENYRLQSKLKDRNSILDSINYKNIVTVQPVDNPLAKGTMCIYLSDMHIGAEVSDESIYPNKYDLNTVYDRLSKVIERVRIINPEFVNVFNLGDAIDGINHSTTRPEHSHFLPQNMTNKEMIHGYIEVMTWFIDTLATFTKVRFLSIGESNHGGDAEYVATLVINEVLNRKGIPSIISSNVISHITINDTTIIYLHGKDTFNQFKPLPLVINDKTETFFNQYIAYNNIQGKVLVVKGDQHQSALTNAKLFEYKSVSSLFGSSAWIQANFGKTDWGVDYSIFYDGGIRHDGRIG